LERLSVTVSADPGASRGKGNAKLLIALLGAEHTTIGVSPLTGLWHFFVGDLRLTPWARDLSPLRGLQQQTIPG
jgi:hypothetical protein